MRTNKGIKYVEDVSKDNVLQIIQEYEKWLSDQCYTPSTIHAYLVPVCKGFSIDLSNINKPKRTAGHLKRSRDDSANQQGKREAECERFKRLVDTQKALGLRRRELSKLTGKDLVENEKGLFVRVKRGKGGKFQFQKILPKHEDSIRSVWRSVGPDQKVFSAAEMKNKIDLHSMRAVLAKEAYDYYEERISNDPVFTADLKQELCDRYLNDSKKCKNLDDLNRWRKQMVDNDRIYKMRGENKENAIAHHRPTEYNRLAMTAVSVLHLSHWRLDVTSVNYLA